MSVSSSAFEIGVSPSALIIEGEVGELLCQHVTLFTPASSLTFTLRDEWAASANAQRDLQSYKFSAASHALSLSYPEYYVTEGTKSQIEVCLKGEVEGSYSGVLLIESVQMPAGLGVWMNVSLSRESGRKQLAGITGASIFDWEGQRLTVLSGSLCVLLLGTLLMMLLHSARRRE